MHLDIRYFDALMRGMRTTLTLDDDNAERLREVAHRTRRPFKTVVNDVIRRGLEEDRVEEVQSPYRVVARPMGLRPGIDPARLAEFEADLDIEHFKQKTARIQEKKS
jgi:hypothetical protein